jgi:hypothetical protein
LLNLPITIALIAKLEQPVFGIVPLVALWTLQIAAPTCAFAITIFGDCEGCATAARYEVHPQPMTSLRMRLAVHSQLSSAIAIDFFFR